MAISIFSFSHLKLPSLSSSLSNPPLTSTILSFSFSKCPILSASSIAAAASDSVRPSFNEFFSIGENDYADEEEDDHEAARSGSGGASFSEAVELFNGGDYYKCHDVLESLWNDAEDPARTLIHGVLQCAVGFHHLFNKNHKGAMMELGEGLCKLRKMNFEGGPFLRFEQEISAVLDFIYQTQLEFAACTDDFCHALDQSEKSYQLLGGYAAGQLLYRLEIGSSGTRYIVFCPERSNEAGEPPRVKLPTLHASVQHLKEVEYDGIN